MKTHGVERAQERSALKAAYDAGASIRTLAAAHGHSYGYVHDALTEAGTQLRGRGGPNNRARNAPAPEKPVGVTQRYAPRNSN
ncbi:helix-turn-helix domain-containing protein [Mycobacteroides abscessus]|uniref:helix-turn-helix domain-containing protein n=1 Tax=Mycobacteroides abscessus TaxID=36809 RepID=UPI0009406D4F|nr:transcriptional regulator [Mycobacteroides abscessus subsp. bolletii]